MPAGWMVRSGRPSPLAASAEQERTIMHHEESLFADPKNWVVLAFILFFVLFGKKLWGVLSEMLDARAVSVKTELEEAHRLRQEAESMLRDAEKLRADALADAKQLIEGARAEAIRVTAAAAAEAEASAKRREQMAVDRISAAEKAAVDDVRLAAADIATTAARQVLAEGLTAGADAVLIDHAISQLPAALAARRAA
jgi:F-type H+-transporting ATPase subunit b